MKFYIFHKDGQLFGKEIEPKPHREDYPKMEIDCFEDVEMEWKSRFDALPAFPVHPNKRLREYFSECLIVQDLMPKGSTFDYSLVNICDDLKTFFPTSCRRCGWVGCSSGLDGGGQIADTGDYGDCYCPYCHAIADGDEVENTYIIPDPIVLGKIIKGMAMGLDKYPHEVPNPERSVATGAQ